MSEEIINGVDISECDNLDLTILNKSYCKEIEYDDGSPAYTCEERPDCYFKQLKRLEEECKILHEAQEQGVEDEEELERLQEENKELKKKNAILVLANSGIEEKNEQLNERVKTFTKPKHYYKGLQKAEDEKDKYKQALEEIKEIVSGNYEILDSQGLQDLRRIISEVLK